MTIPQHLQCSSCTECNKHVLDLYTFKCFGRAVLIYKHWCSLKNLRLVKFYIIFQRQLSRDYAHTVLCRSTLPWFKCVLIALHTCSLLGRVHSIKSIEGGTCSRQCIWHVKHISWHVFLNIKHGGMKSSQIEPEEQDCIHVAGLSLLSSNVCSSVFLL